MKKNSLLALFFFVITAAMSVPASFAKGDLDCDSTVGLRDIIIALQIVSDNISEEFCAIDDVNEDGKVGLAEAVYGLRRSAGLISAPQSSPFAHLTGRVTGSGGLADVKISAGPVSTTTDPLGNYRLENISIPDTGRLLITCKKDGYAVYHRCLSAEAGKVYTVSPRLTAYDITEKLAVPAADQITEVTEAGGKKAGWLNISAGSFSDADSGDVRVSIAVCDPSADADRDVFPGDYMAFSGADDIPDTPLESIVFAEISLADSQGEIKELSRPGEIILRLPDAYQNGGEKAGDYIPGDSENGTAPWWSYSETLGGWVRADADPDAEGIQDAVVEDIDGELYVRAGVSRLTWWSAGPSIDKNACLCLQVTDPDDAAMPGIEVIAEGLSYDGNSRPVRTGYDGRACVNVKQTANAQSPEKVKITARAGTILFPYDVTDPAEGDADADLIYAGSSGTCRDLMNPVRISFAGKIQGTVIKDVSGSAISDVAIYSNFGTSATTDYRGYYELNMPLYQDVLLFVPEMTSETVRLTKAAETLNIVLPNRAPVIDGLTQDPSGKVKPGHQVVFTATARDPDEDPLTYSWNAASGVLNTTTGFRVIWTAPEGQGAGSVKLTAKDNRGAETSEARTVIWGEDTQGTSLKFIIKDTRTNRAPVSDIYVILHGADNKTVEQFIKTDTDGIADFGDIGRERSTVTIAYEQNFSTEWGNWKSRYVKTFADMLSGETVYYIYQPSDSDELPYCETPQAVISAALAWENGISPEVAWLSVLPFNGYSEDNVNFNGMNVCSDDIQNDGRISFLATASGFDDDYGQGLLKYGFLLDQEITEEQIYTIPMDKDPSELIWRTCPPTAVQGVSLSGIRKGIRYSWTQGWSEVPETVGTLDFPGEFPLDTYQVAAASLGKNTDDTSLSAIKKYETVFRSLTIPMPDFNFGELQFDKQNMIVSWSFSGTMEPDWMAVSFSAYGEQREVPIFWTGMTDGKAGAWSVPDLPDAIRAWFDADTLTDPVLEATDMDIYDGTDMYWHAYREGDDPSAEYERMFSARGYFPGRVSKNARQRGVSDPHPLPSAFN